MTISVLLVDDQSLLRMGFRMVLEAEDDLQVVGEAADGATGTSMATALRPDVVLMDVRMPGTNGIDATAQITATLPDAKVLILTTFDLDEYAFAGLRAGASGFLLKDTKPAELVEAVRTVHRGDAVIAPRVTRRMLELFGTRLPSDSEDHAAPSDALEEELSDLTPREREVLLALAAGLSNAEIAAQFVVSEATIKTHVGKVLGKLGLRDRVQAVIFAYESGLVRP
ncbi:response regulator [Pseudactinotalea sp.]|uniref:response regulator n=1 Tax=Pseudactinotalea sp. TaxID=1926260 RepID=UPI003B3BE743